jgi:hypothetical protein
MITLEQAKEKASQNAFRAETKTTVHIDAFALEKWFKSVFGKELEFVATTECDNDSSHEFDVDGIVDNNTYDKQAEAFIYGDRKSAPNYGINSVLNVLCRDGFIPAGEYVVSVSW